MGCTLYELATHNKLFDAADDDAQMMSAIIHKLGEPPSAFRSTYMRHVRVVKVRSVVRDGGMTVWIL